jgi:hypothetical protein
MRYRDLRLLHARPQRYQRSGGGEKKGPGRTLRFLSTTIGEEIAFNAMRAGAQDYVIKGKAAR